MKSENCQNSSYRIERVLLYYINSDSCLLMCQNANCYFISIQLLIVFNLLIRIFCYNGITLVFGSLYCYVYMLCHLEHSVLGFHSFINLCYEKMILVTNHEWAVGGPSVLPIKYECIYYSFVFMLFHTNYFFNYQLNYHHLILIQSSHHLKPFSPSIILLVFLHQGTRISIRFDSLWIKQSSTIGMKGKEQDLDMFYPCEVLLSSFLPPFPLISMSRQVSHKLTLKKDTDCLKSMVKSLVQFSSYHSYIVRFLVMLNQSLVSFHFFQFFPSICN